jgi:uncharacterized protein YijF (DUF1287 family)
MSNIPRVLILILSVTFASCSHRSVPVLGRLSGGPQTTVPVKSAILKSVIDDALDQTHYTVGYDPSYVKLEYPGGDVPRETGVCADVIIRAFRKGGVDLQKEVHEDMARNFSAYPTKWGLPTPDSNIDHRRVLNLMTYFQRQGRAALITSDPADYSPGDVVAWDLDHNLPHIGLVVNVKPEGGRRFLIVHNVGGGARLEDVMFSWKIIGHYRYFR